MIQNKWSCLPKAFATALNIPFDDFIGSIGHDGSKIIWAQLPEPQCRRGFHVQECIEICLLCGYSVTPIELMPRHAPCPGIDPITIYFKDNFKRFETIIKCTQGVITGESNRCGHAVTYRYGYIIDGIAYPYSINNCKEHNFIPKCAWIIK